MKIQYITLLLLCGLISQGCNGDSISFVSSTFDSQPIWAEWDYGSGDTILLVTLAGTLYRSSGGSTFSSQTARIPDWGQASAPFNRNGLRAVVATNDANRLYLVGYSNIWTTADAGQTYQKAAYAADVIFSSLLPHPTDASVALMTSYSPSCYTTDKSSCNQRLYVTQNFGQSWTQISSYVSRYRWAANANADFPRIYASRFTSASSGNQFSLDPQTASLVLTDNYFGDSRLLLANVSSFAVKANFVDAASHSFAGTAQMWTSGNYGKTFTHFAAPNWAYALVLTPFVSSQTIFMMPASNVPAYTSMGQAWHSDVTGANFVLSAARMSVVQTGVEFHYDDLIPGVFFANFVDISPATGAAAKYTMVSRNNGGSWARLPAPVYDSLGAATGCSLSSGCSLHLVLAMQQPGSFVTNPTSPGTIVGRGNYGQFYDASLAAQNTFISTDSGVSWREIQKGSCAVAVQQYGSLLVSAQLGVLTSSLQYSYTQGASWSNVLLPAQEQVLAVVASPSNDTGVFLVITPTRAYIVNFPNGMVRQCTSADYYTWSPKDPQGRNCLLGRGWLVTSRYGSSACLPPSPLPPIRYLAACPCSTSDFECAFGYVNSTSSNTCVPSDVTRAASPSSATTRRISGDACVYTRSDQEIQIN